MWHTPIAGYSLSEASPVYTRTKLSPSAHSCASGCDVTCSKTDEKRSSSESGPATRLTPAPYDSSDSRAWCHM